ncbi:hypothetical protein QUW63_01845 [Pseudoflavonifractor phocaeensis]|nr:hypothetical protein [Pseudoflavonifractor phocaeensis]MDM8237844.1 hypothetical protein [Pseudoflavonifractor phocaeensis]
MTTANQKEILAVALKKEIMLQINQRLFLMGIISEEVYQQAQEKIVTGT